MLFARSRQGDIILIHAYLKSTRKTPAREARQAIAVFDALDNTGTVDCDQRSMRCET